MAPAACLLLVNGLWNSSEGRGGEGAGGWGGDVDRLLFYVVSRFLRALFFMLVTGVLQKRMHHHIGLGN